MKLFLTLMAIAVVASGCTSKSKAELRAREAYMAGQRDAMARAGDAQNPNVRFVGPVRNREMQWYNGLTLALAISAAGYTDARDPRTIVIHRRQERIPFDPADLLRGKDVELEPGDTIEIQP